MTNLALDYWATARRPQQQLASTCTAWRAALPCRVPAPDRLVDLLNACDAGCTPRGQIIQHSTLRTRAGWPVVLHCRACRVVEGGGGQAAG